MLDTRDRCPGHVGRDERLEGEVSEDEEGGMVRVDEPWDVWRASAGTGSRGSCGGGNVIDGRISRKGVEFSRIVSSSPTVTDVGCPGMSCEIEGTQLVRAIGITG